MVLPSKELDDLTSASRVSVLIGNTPEHFLAALTGLLPRLESSPTETDYAKLSAYARGLIQSPLRAHEDRLIQDTYVLTQLSQYKRRSVLKALDKPVSA